MAEPLPNRASTFARALLRQLVALGVHHVVLSPGARSQALALEAARLEGDGIVRLHVRTDERTAGFTALGLALESNTPAALITTSGSAVANLLPAVLEAHHAGVPMLVLTADRPARLRGIRSNQTTRQDLMLAPFVTDLIDVAAPSGLGDDRNEALADWRVSDARLATELAERAWAAAQHGPAQLNLQFDVPLSGLAADLELTAPRAPEPPSRTQVELPIGPRTLVVAGSGAGPDAEALARALHAPLIAEVSSGAHFGPQLVVAYRPLLRMSEFAESIERVVVFGSPNLSREIGLIGFPGIELVVVNSPGADRFLPAERSADDGVVYVDALRVTGEAGAQLSEWGRVWVAASRKLLADATDETAVTPSGVAYGGHVEDFAAQREYVKAERAAIRAEVTRERLVQAVWSATWPHDRLLFGASRLIRVADSTLPGKNVPVFANRGQSGIDGTIATGIGLAVSATGGTTRVLLGDLAALHDAGSLKLTPGEASPSLQVIVGNDRGGSIFTGLEVAATADAAAFERVQLTPHNVDFAALAAAYGWEYRRATDVGALDQALTQPADRPVLIEVPLK